MVNEARHNLARLNFLTKDLFFELADRNRDPSRERRTVSEDQEIATFLLKLLRVKKERSITPQRQAKFESSQKIRSQTIRRAQSSYKPKPHNCGFGENSAEQLKNAKDSLAELFGCHTSTV